MATAIQRLFDHTILSSNSAVLINIITGKFVSQSRTGLQIYEGHDDQFNRPGPVA
jgi:hypothetical protein